MWIFVLYRPLSTKEAILDNIKGFHCEANTKITRIDTLSLRKFHRISSPRGVVCIEGPFFYCRRCTSFLLTQSMQISVCIINPFSEHGSTMCLEYSGVNFCRRTSILTLLVFHRIFTAYPFESLKILRKDSCFSHNTVEVEEYLLGNLRVR